MYMQSTDKSLYSLSSKEYQYWWINNIKLVLIQEGQTLGINVFCTLTFVKIYKNQFFIPGTTYFSRLKFSHNKQYNF